MAHSSVRSSLLLGLLPPEAAGFVRRRVEEIGGLGLIILGTLLVIAWLSYNPLDPAPNVAAPGPTRNLLGGFGAAASDLGLRSLGLGYLLLIFILLAWGWRLFAHKGISRPLMRLSVLPLVLVAGAVALGALPMRLPDTLPAGRGGWIAQLALPGIDLLGPLLGGISRGTLGLIAAGFAGVALVFVLGFSVGEWRSLGLGTAAAVMRASLAARRSAETGGRGAAEAARAGFDRALRSLRREPHFGGEPPEDQEPQEPTLDAAPVGEAVTPRPPDELLELPGVALPIVERPQQRPEIRPEPPAGAPKAQLVEPRLERAAPPKRPVAKQATLDLVPSDQYRLPPTDLLKAVPIVATQELDSAALEANARLLESVLQDFGVRGEIVKVRPGPVVTLYELEPAPGTKSSRVIGLADDIARSMSAIAVRIAVVPGRSVIGIELPNAKRETIYLRDVLTSEAYEQTASKLALILGKDIGGTPTGADLARMPHLLIAGTTGSGKSVAINAMVLSLLYKSTAEHVRMIMIDPKMLELSVYEGIPQLLAPVVTDMKQAANALRWCVAEMERRFQVMSTLGVRNISGYNRHVRDANAAGRPIKDPILMQRAANDPSIDQRQIPDLGELPFVVVVIDELADLMMMVGKKVEELIARLAQKARASGIHLILATQRPSVDVITGLIKANIPTRIAFQVSARVDSRTILDQMEAESLLGHGDMLYLPPGTSLPTRVHGAFVSDQEVHRVVEALKTPHPPNYLEEVLSGPRFPIPGLSGGAETNGGGAGDAEQDPLYDEAVQIVVGESKPPVSYVQRLPKISDKRA